MISPYSGAGLDASSIFLEVPTYSSGGYFALSIAVADVNGDGEPDLLVAKCASSGDCSTGGEVGVLLNNGDGSFQTAVSYGSGGYLAESIAVGDVNGDGKPDLLVANQCASYSDCVNGVVGVLLGNGDGSFQAAASYGSGGYFAYSVAVGDVNGDGKLDLLLTNACPLGECRFYDGVVGVLLGTGDGTFQMATSYNSGFRGARGVTASDVNGDGKLDLLVVNCPNDIRFCDDYQRGVVGTLLGNGDGTFQTAVTYDSGGYYPYSVAVQDVNGDSKPDLLVVNECAVVIPDCQSGVGRGAVGLLLGNGDGTFQTAVTYDSGGYYARAMAVDDVNADAKPDLVVLNSSSVAVLLGNGDGTFQMATSYNSGGQYHSSVVVGDVNGDSKPDLLIAHTCADNSCADGSIGVLLGSGNGTFQAAPVYDTGGYGASSVAVGDVNGDGNPDLLVADSCSFIGYNCRTGAVGVLLGKTGGSFQTPVSYGSGGQYAYSVAIGDVNRDGELDLIVANHCASYIDCVNGIVAVLLGNGDGTFQAAVTYDSGGYSALSVTVADVNGDGKPDLLVANRYASVGDVSGRIGVLLGNGDGSFQAAVSYGSGGDQAFSVAVADVNGDGRPDVLVANQCASSGDCSTGGGVSVLLNNGDGSFQAAVSYGSSGYLADSVAIGDVNGDGKPDVLVANQCASNCVNGIVGVLLGNGDGTFQPATATTTPTIGFGSLSVTDFNGDGKLDAASGAGSFLLLGNGDGTFDSPLNLGVTGPGVAVGDFNHDGKPDLAVGGVTVLLNVSTPHTATTTSLVSSFNPSGFNQAVTFTATVTPQGSGTPTGTVTFTDSAVTLGTATLTNGTAVLSTASLGVGSHSITASYDGDSNFSGSVSPPLQQIVNPAASSTTVVSSVNPVFVTQPVTFTATVSGQFGGIATGTVTFKAGPKVLGTSTLTGGAASWTATFATIGTRSIRAIYSGDANFQASTSAVLKEVVVKAPSTTAVASSQNPSQFGQSVTFTATVTSIIGFPADGETVTFKDGPVTLGIGTLGGGVATFTTSTLTVGKHRIKAVYPGDEKLSRSSSSILKQQVN